MRKRIRVHQLRVGMFVEDVESGGPHISHRFSPFMISSPDEVARMMNSNLMTVVIDVRKGVDVEAGASSYQPIDASAFHAQLLVDFSARDIHQARQSISDTKPHIRSVLSEARINGAFAAKTAVVAVQKIMTAAMDNVGALVAVAKLKEKDEVTFLHSLAVSALMIAFGRSLGHDEDDVRLLGIGGLVHDLGKMVLPNTILTKAGKLTAEEMDLVREHPQRGYELVSRLENSPQQVLDICLYHHEKFDGSGYPKGLAGSEIPYVARLAAICDVYDALTTIRPYKRAWSQGEAINVMMNSPGHFDTDLLSAFVSKMVINGTLH
ncbi:putative nucleotidyltransferase with HDIG domain [Rhizobium sp. SJZ105]|uniref:HD-GYP domain-containing protein n=1 Tax=Rhizobium sp. SJZ105 TaxID=2572678 RepID=UPI0011A21540|nr:HD-GYP domain-containing protein [Rhizobium sp. SJZ105]TWC78365.1 putative nucleotidyltransferase with HDIG domain [Rhizobium sp. SJZ105]